MCLDQKPLIGVDTLSNVDVSNVACHPNLMTKSLLSSRRQDVFSCILALVNSNLNIAVYTLYQFLKLYIIYKLFNSAQQVQKSKCKEKERAM